ncbi:MAG TPA: hypothetical protein VGI30_13365 [Caulobacteraceae bacterium]|jgi:hypothetical protein
MAVGKHLLTQLRVSVDHWLTRPMTMMAARNRRWRQVVVALPVSPTSVHSFRVGGGMDGRRVVTMLVRSRHGGQRSEHQ